MIILCGILQFFVVKKMIDRKVGGVVRESMCDFWILLYNWYFMYMSFANMILNTNSIYKINLPHTYK